MPVVYKNEKLRIKRVYYSGTDQLREGYCLCYDRDAGTATATSKLRAYQVEKPATANLGWFAGVVHPHSDYVTGPAWITIIEPSPGGVICKAWAKVSGTINTTALAITNGQYYVGAEGAANVRVAQCNQTVDRSSTAGLMQVKLFGGGGAALSTLLAAPTGGTTGGTFLLDNIPGGGYSADEVANIEDNFTKIVDYINAMRATLRI